MDVQQTLTQILTCLTHIEADLAQLGPVARKTTMAEEIAAVRAQGLDIGEYFKNKRKVKK